MPKPKERWITKGLLTSSAFDPGSSYYVEDYKAETAGSAWGIVMPCATSGRESPPNPRCFKTEDSWFDRGHLMALELGGSDSKANLIPQCRHENEHGSWRRKEVAIKALALSEWEDERYVYFGAQAIYKPKEDNSFYSTVPTEIQLFAFSFAAKHLATVKTNLPKMPPLLAESAATAIGVEIKAHVSHAVFSNELTAQDLEAVHGDITKLNKEHAIAYWAGKSLHAFQLEYGKAAADSVLQYHFDTSGRKINTKQRAIAGVWRDVYSSAEASPQINEQMIEASDPDAKEKAQEAKAAYQLGLKTRDETITAERLKLIREKTPLAIPDLDIAKRTFLEESTKRGLRRRDSILVDLPDTKAGNDLMKLEAAIEQVKKTGLFSRPIVDEPDAKKRRA